MSSSTAPDPFRVREHDLAMLTIAPQNQTDPRVPLAEGFAAWAKMMMAINAEISQYSGGGFGWATPPIFQVAGPRSISISGTARLPSCRGEIALDAATVQLPPLPNTSSTIAQEDGLYLVGLVCEVGAEQDEVLGMVSFQYRDPETDTVVTIEKENERRFRSLWAVFRGGEDFDPDLFAASLADSADGKKILNVANVAASGFPFAEGNLYCLDGNWVPAKSYAVLPELTTWLPICRVVRKQNITERGYTWGFNGEAPFDADYAIARTGSAHDLKATAVTRIERRLQEIFAGIPGGGRSYSRTVQNLIAGAATGVAGIPGESSGAPNGSVNLANGQRVTFTNQGVKSTLAVEAQAAGNDGAGNAVVTFTLGNAPSGTRFSEKAGDHRIYNAQGKDVSARGRWANLGLSGTLIWTAEDNPDIVPGAIAYFQAAVVYPSGSGFAVPFEKLEKCWYDAQEIPEADLREASVNDLDAYEDPSGATGKIVVVGKERAALHYMYSKISVVTDGTGVAAVPSAERGCFAFLRGVDGRIDAPVATGLAPNQTYDALVYYPPRTDEVWQFQFKYCPYQGMRNLGEVPDLTIFAPPIAFVHSQGGGASAFFGGKFRYVPLAMHLPESSSGVPAHSLNTPVEFEGEGFSEPVSMRSALPVASRDAAPGQVGQVVALEPAAATPPRGAAVRCTVGGATLGCQIPALSTGLAYQFVLAVPVASPSGDEYLLVATKNSAGGSMELDASAGTAIDLFRI